MNPRLGREAVRQMAKARLTIAELSARSGLTESWIKAIRTGRIDRPEPERLAAFTRETGGDYEALLALSNQLGAAHHTAGPKEATPFDPADLSDLRAALMSQSESMARLLQFAIRRDHSVEARIRAMEAELESLRGRLGVEGSPERSTPRQTGESEG